jgi:hypothetical protein
MTKHLLWSHFELIHLSAWKDSRQKLTTVISFIPTAVLASRPNLMLVSLKCSSVFTARKYIENRYGACDLQTNS